MSRIVQTPMYFGVDQQPLFGWLHAAHGLPGQALGIVVCPPIGQESINCHRSLQVICSTLASAGFPALRFDYAGCGDSAGSDRDPQRLAAWTASVQRAIEALKHATAVRHVVLVGISFGATLAALAAQGRGDVAGLVAISPIINGRLLAREWRTMHSVRHWRRKASKEPQPDAQAAPLEAAGYLVTDETLKSIASIDLVGEVAFGGRILVIDRDDIGGSQSWVRALDAAGVFVERRVRSGFLSMMRDPAYATVPQGIVQDILTWTQRCAQGIGPAPTPREADRGAPPPLLPQPCQSVVVGSSDGVAIRETLLVREDDGLQFGVMSEAEAEPGAASYGSRPALLLVNAGAVHHVGPSRLYVELARHFAAVGFIVLRVDLSGLGDSDAHTAEPQGSPYTRRGVEDIARWLAFARARRNVGPCHLLGICSGGFQVFRAAMDGLPFSKVLSLNPVNFYWTEGMALDVPFHDLHPYDLQHQVVSIAAGYRRSLLDPRKWRKLLGGRVDWRLALRVAHWRVRGWLRNRALALGRALGLPLADDLGADLERFCSRRSGLELIFSRGDPGRSILYERAGPVVDRLRKRRKLTVLEVPGADHTFSSETARAALKALLAERLAA